MNELEELVDRRLAEQGADLSSLAAGLATERGTLERVLAHPDQLGVEDAMALAAALGMSVDDIGAAAFHSSRLSGAPDADQADNDAVDGKPADRQDGESS